MRPFWGHFDGYTGKGVLVSVSFFGISLLSDHLHSLPPRPCPVHLTIYLYDHSASLQSICILILLLKSFTTTWLFFKLKEYIFWWNESYIKEYKTFRGNQKNKNKMNPASSSLRFRKRIESAFPKPSFSSSSGQPLPSTPADPAPNSHVNDSSARGNRFPACVYILKRLTAQFFLGSKCKFNWNKKVK